MDPSIIFFIQKTMKSYNDLNKYDENQTGKNYTNMNSKEKKLKRYLKCTHL